MESKSRHTSVSYHLVSLSAALTHNPPAFDGTKLNLVNANINAIDDIARQLAVKVKTLYLSNNSISSLAGIESFSSVVNASISHNLIRYLEELQPLARLKHLEKLSLDGNVVTAVPYYRDFVISLCKNLQTLDGVRISNAERASASLGSRKLESIFQQLRLNELHTCVLAHLQSRLRCKIEMAEVVAGRFRVLRGSHIESHQLLDKPVSTSTVLTQALKGGVYRWLQSYNVNMFNRLVQNLTRKAYLGLLRKMTPTQRNRITQNQAILCNFWDDILAECISYQQTKIISLLELCNYSLESLNSAAIVDSAEHNYSDGGVNVLQRIGFVDDSTDHHHRDGPDVSYCGIGRPHDRVEERRSQEPPKLQSTQSIGKHHTRKGQHATSSIDENMLRAATQEKYALLLRSHAKDTTTSKVNSSLSSFLPPQQEEPIHDKDKENQHHNYDVSFSNAAQAVISSAEVTAFLHRCFETPASSSSSSSSLDFSWDNKVSNLPEQVDIGPKPLAPTAPLAVEDSNMKAMKKVVQDAFQELSIRQRNAALCATANEGLRKKFVDARKQLMNNIECGRALLSKCKTAILTLTDDITKGEAWCQVCDTIIVAVEKQKQRVAHVDNEIIALDKGRSDACEATQGEVGSNKELVEARRQVADALAAVDFEINNDPVLLQLFRRHYITDKVMHTFVDMKNRAIKKRVLALWRLRIDRQLRIRQFTTKTNRKRGLVIARGSMTTWKTFVYVNKLGGVLRLVHCKATLYQQLRRWKAAFVFSRRMKSFQRRRVLLMKHRALCMLYQGVRVAKMLAVKNRYTRQKRTVSLARQFFRAIKATYISSRPDKVKEAANIFKAMKMRKCRFFKAWQAIVTSLHLKWTTAEKLVAGRNRVTRLSAFLTEWHNVASAYVHHRLYRCKCYVRKWRTRRHKKLSTRKYWEVIFKISRPSMKACRKVLRRLRSIVMSTRRLNAAARTLQTKASFRLTRSVYQHWLLSYRGRRLEQYLSTKAHASYCRKLVSTVFSSWRTVLSSTVVIETTAPAFTVDEHSTVSSKRDRHRACGVSKALIYVSDDDDDDVPLRSRHASHFCVMILRFLSRWRHRARELSTLRAKGFRLHETNQRCCLRRFYSNMINRYLLGIRSKVTRCFQENSRKESTLMSVASVNGQFQFISADSRDTSHSESLPDSLRREIKDANTKIAALRNDVHSLMDQLSETERLNYDMAVGLGSVQATYDIIKNEYKRCINDTALLKDSSCRIMEAYQSAQKPVKHKEDMLKYAVADNKDILEEKQQLAAGVEECYKKTSQLQQKATKKKNQLASSARAAVEYSMQCKSCILDHDNRIEMLTSDRHHLDASLVALKSALHESINGISANALFNEKAIQEISREEEYLSEKLETLSKEEQALKLEMDQLQKEASLMQKRMFLENASHLSEDELNARSYQIYSSGQRDNLLADNDNRYWYAGRSDQGSMLSMLSMLSLFTEPLSKTTDPSEANSPLADSRAPSKSIPAPKKTVASLSAANKPPTHASSSASSSASSTVPLTVPPTAKKASVVKQKTTKASSATHKAKSGSSSSSSSSTTDTDEFQSIATRVRQRLNSSPK